VIDLPHSPLPDELSDEPIQLTVEARAHGWRVDHYLARLFPNYSRGVFQRAIAAEAVLVNGLPVKPSRRLRVNDRLSVSILEQPDERIEPEDIPLELIYEDDVLAVVNKPAGMVTHPSKGQMRGTLAAAVQFHFDRLSDVAGRLRPGIVHRLDRDTTGVILIAKSNQTHHRLSAQFERREVRKEYRALVRGEIDRQSDVIDTFLRVHPRAREKMIVCGDAEGARRAVTQYEVLERFQGFTYVRLLPQTGRTHQLRVHMQHIGHPIVADRLYAGHGELRVSELRVGESAEPGSIAGSLASHRSTTDDTLIDRQALHAYRLEVRHPVTDRPLIFEAALPEDLSRTLDALRRYRAVRREVR
jgi:23S rRNA pseudouridine1911/1915/1917 synthase